MKRAPLEWLGLCVVLASCGGGGGGGGNSSSTVNNSTISGVAAYGAPLADATIVVSDGNGRTTTATADANGVYSATVTGFTAPLLIVASANSGESTRRYLSILDSVPAVGTTATANVTPLTLAVVAMASTNGTDPEEFVRDASKLKNLNTADIATAVTKLQGALGPVLTDVGLSNSFNPMRTVFAADRNSAGDKLLDTIKVSVSDQGVNLLNARAPIANNGAGDSNSVTIKGISGAAPSPLPTPTLPYADLVGLDAWRNQANSCLALPPAQRVSNSGGTYTFLSSCAAVTGFSFGYKYNGYTLAQTWGPRLLNGIPAGAVMAYPEILTFIKNAAGDDTALVRLSYSSPVGGGSYIETARKISGQWAIDGNQRNYDAGVTVALQRQEDVSTNPWKVGGVSVGKASAYYSRIYFRFNQTGPNGSDVYAVRVKGPGLPATGLVFARSSACGPSDFLAFYSNDGGLPPATLASQPTSSTGNGWNLDAVPWGSNYTGSNFYSDWRGTYDRFSSSAQTPVVFSTIPEFASYAWEVFTTANGATPSATFNTRMATRPVAASEGSKMPWASFSAAAREYVNPSVSAKAGELTSVNLDWTVTTSAPRVRSAYIVGFDGTNRMTLDSNVAKLGDTSVSPVAVEERNANNGVCSYNKLPAFSATTGSRFISTRQSTERGLQLQQSLSHSGRS